MKNSKVMASKVIHSQILGNFLTLLHGIMKAELLEGNYHDENYII